MAKRKRKVKVRKRKKKRKRKVYQTKTSKHSRRNTFKKLAGAGMVGFQLFRMCRDFFGGFQQVDANARRAKQNGALRFGKNLVDKI